MLETLDEVAVKEKHLKSSFLALPACNNHHVWLILPFGIVSNLFKLLCIEVISKYNILFLVDNWYYCFVCNDWFSMILKLRFDWKVLLRF